MENDNGSVSVANSCNLAFLDENMTITIANNVATVIVGYFIENVGMQTVTDVFNSGTLTYSKDFTISNISTSNELLTITQTDGQIQYNGNLGELVSGETVLVTIQFDIIGVTNAGEYIISNISKVEDGQGDAITYSENVLLNVVELSSNVDYKDGKFNFSITNRSIEDVRVGVDADITIPSNIEVIFRNFEPFKAVYINTSDVVPTNQVIKGFNTVKLSIEEVVIRPYSTVVLSVDFDLYSSSEIGFQQIVAQLQQTTLPKDLVFIRRSPDKSNKAQAIVNLLIR